MPKENPRDIHFDANGADYVIPGDSFVRLSDDEFMEDLCNICRHSRLNCANIYVREVEIPLADNENLDDHGTRVQQRQPDGTLINLIVPFKWVDGIKAGIYKTEKDVPQPFICQWFEPKDPG